MVQPRLNVELEIILPRDMTVQESHDLSLELQHKVVSFPWQELISMLPGLEAVSFAICRGQPTAKRVMHDCVNGPKEAFYAIMSKTLQS